MNSEEERTENMSGGLVKDKSIFFIGNYGISMLRGKNGCSNLRETENINLGYGRSDRETRKRCKDERRKPKLFLTFKNIKYLGL